MALTSLVAVSSASILPPSGSMLGSLGAVVGFELFSAMVEESGGNIPLRGGWFAVDGRSREVELEKIFFAVEEPFVGEVWPNENGEFLVLLAVASFDAFFPLSLLSLDNGFALSEGEDIENLASMLAQFLTIEVDVLNKGAGTAILYQGNN